MFNKSVNSDFDALSKSNEKLLVELFQVVPKLKGGLLKPPPLRQ